MYGGMCTGHFTLGVINVINRFRELKIECHLASLMNESLITRARNELARMFLDDEKFTHLMFIDSDIYFEHDSVDRLYSHDKSIVCGLYPKKEINWDRVREAVKNNRKDLNYYASNFVLNLPLDKDKIEPNKQGLIEVRHSGTGFMMIKREVFEKLSPHVPEYRSSTLKDPLEIISNLWQNNFLTRVLIAQELYFRKIIIFVNYGGNTEAKFTLIPTFI